MAGRQVLGCVHAQNASESQKEAFKYAVRLHIATILGTSSFHGACHECNNASLPLCCLDCDFIGCPHHTAHEHNLACVLGTENEGALWCFQCRDVVVDSKFDQIRQAEIHTALQASQHGEPEPAELPVKISGDIPFHAFAGLRGLVNLGATCYVSVVLQSLVHNPLVRAFFLGGGHQRELCTKNSCLVCSVDRLYTNFYGSASVAGYGITDLLIALAEKQPFLGAGSTEQDAHEFYLMLLSEFHTGHHQKSALNGYGGSNGHALGNGNGNGNSTSGTSSTSTNGNAHNEIDHCGCVTHRTFAGTIVSLLQCECGKSTERREHMVDLGLDLGSATSTTLDASLQRFVTPEPVSHYTCDECGQQNTTTKQLRLADPPPVLLIQLKRFKHVGGTKGSIKVETPVDFPLQIDLSPYTSAHQHSRPLVYELYGVINHIGTLDTGHYTCMMKLSSGQWYNFDDVTVTPVSVDTVRRANRAYLLFYIVKWAI